MSALTILGRRALPVLLTTLTLFLTGFTKPVFGQAVEIQIDGKKVQAGGVIQLNGQIIRANGNGVVIIQGGVNGAKVAATTIASDGKAEGKPGDPDPDVDPMKDFPEATRKAFDEALGIWIKAIAGGREKLATKRLNATADELKQEFNLKDEPAAILKAAVKDAVAESRKPWEQAMINWVKTIYAPRLRADEANALKNIQETSKSMAAMTEDQIDSMLEDAPISPKGDPRNQNAWKTALAKALSPEQFAKHNDKAGKEKQRAEKLIAELRDRILKSLEGRLRKEIQPLVQLLRNTIPLDEARAKAIDEAAAAAVAEAVALRAKSVTQMLESIPEPSRQQMLTNQMENFSLGEDGQEEAVPSKQKSWTEGLAKVLTKEEFADWDKALKTHVVAEDKKAREDLARLIDTVSENYRQNFTQQMDPLVADIRSSISLDADRSKRLEEAAKKAVDVAIEAWKKRAAEQVMKLPSQQRDMMMQQGYVSVGWSEDDQPQNQKQWKDDIAALLTPEEKTQWETAKTQRKESRRRVATLVMISALDERIAFTTSQRTALEPIIAKIADKQLAPRMEQQWGSMNFQTIANYARGIDRKEIDPLLEDWQRELWQTQVVDANRSDNMDNGPEPAAPGPLDLAPAIPDPVAVEAAISDYLLKMARLEREQAAARMKSASFDIARAAKISDTTQKRLSIAAKGAVEEEITAWFNQYNDWVRNQINSRNANILPANIAGHLRQFGRVNFGNRARAEDNPLWKTATATLLNETERTAWARETGAREAYRKQATIALILTDFDNQVRLTSKQTTELEALAIKAFDDYSPDIDRYFGSRDPNSPWELNSYYNALILQAVPEATMKKTLTEHQWKIWDTQYRNRTQGYWDNIQRYHEERTKKESDKKGNAQQAAPAPAARAVIRIGGAVGGAVRIQAAEAKEKK